MKAARLVRVIRSVVCGRREGSHWRAVVLKAVVDQLSVTLSRRYPSPPETPLRSRIRYYRLAPLLSADADVDAVAEEEGPDEAFPSCASRR